MRLRLATLLIGLFLLPSVSMAQEVSQAPSVVLTGVPFQITVSGGTEASAWVEVQSASGAVLYGGTVDALSQATATDVVIGSGDELPLTVLIGDTSHTVEATAVPGWFSILPPFVAILLALIFREVVTALFAGVWLGALAVAGFNPLAATARTIDQFVVPAVGNVDDGRTHILAFTLLLGGMVGIISKNGGTHGIVEAVSPMASNARRGKLATWMAGFAVFFDDYANTLIVGNTMRPITDRLRISREKLAYLVDSTAAPVAAMVPISTWVGYEISQIQTGLGIAAAQTPEAAPALAGIQGFGFFIQTIPYLFYPILALLFVVMTSATNRDFGPMAEAERRAAAGKGLFREGAMLAADTESGDLTPKDGVTHRWYNAAIPVLTVIVVVLVGLVSTGRASAGPDADLVTVFENADPFATLLWGSLGGVIVAMALSLGQRTLTMHEGVDAFVGGMRSMMIALIILALAWSLGDVTQAIGTAQFLTLVLSDRVAIELIPAIVFITSAAIAFATGTSWGTMAILLPVVIPLTIALGGVDVLPGAPSDAILLGATASVLAGAIFGDHCSPISDTTVLSSTASACDHVDHVRTQLPYAVLVGAVGILLGNIGTAYGLPAWMALLIGAAVLFGVLRAIGVDVTEVDPVDGSPGSEPAAAKAA